jgi:hypothetical protein
MTLKINDFNLGYCKNYGMFTPQKYLTKTIGKKSKIIPQLWTMEIAQSTILNLMKIPHFERHQEVNVCIKTSCLDTMVVICGWTDASP